MRVKRRRIDSLGIIKNNGRIDQESEHAGADQVPEGHRDEEIDRPFVSVFLSTGFDNPQIVHNFKSQKGEGNDFQSRKHGAQRNNRGRSPCPEKMMKSAQNTAAQIKKNRKM